MVYSCDIVVSRGEDLKLFTTDTVIGTTSDHVTFKIPDELIEYGTEGDKVIASRILGGVMQPERPIIFMGDDLPSIDYDYQKPTVWHKNPFVTIGVPIIVVLVAVILSIIIFVVIRRRRRSRQGLKFDYDYLDTDE
eukprot:TRINITY_DN14125_c0_g1_i1.p1 TRINITY_DN14125_c0_g1~~TRINITY_DN14125_c0_g1_i1.p1  ORF type:complete len:136 (+),score=34.37 TRINITY_DN14125_c0_g1_i1:192-599(+)